ncbi:MAG: cytosine permease [Oscillospiraceae bacterium]|nr:cytosine permease [Oscillospiraceae bacterium]
MSTSKKEASSAEAYVNDYATLVVPRDKRRSSFSLAMVLIGSIICLSSIYTGASFAGELTLRQVVIACLVGNVILSVLGGAMSYIGTRTGVGIAMLMRQCFGVLGNYIIAILTAVVELGWFGWQCGFFGDTIHAMFPGAGFITDPTVAAIWGGLLMMTTAYIGYKGLELLSNIAAPLILITCIAGCVIGVVKVGGMEAFSELSLEVSGGMTVATGIVSVIGAYVMGTVLQPDLTRYGKKESHSVIGAVFGFIVANSFVILAGYFICVACNTSDVSAALMQILGAWALVMLIFAQWTTNDNNLYFSSLAATVAFPRFKKKHIVLVFGIVATIAGAVGIVDSFTTWLSLLGTGIPPVAGILILDYFFLKKKDYHFGEGVKHRFCSVPAIVAWVLGCIVGYTVSWGISSINGMVVAGVVYVLMFLIFKNKPEALYIGGTYMEDAKGAVSKVSE